MWVFIPELAFRSSTLPTNILYYIIKQCYLINITYENMGFGLEKLKEIVKDRNKWCRLVEEKTRNRERTNIKRQKGKAMANHPWTLNLPRKS
jgi:hypothetical protein